MPSTVPSIRAPRRGESLRLDLRAHPLKLEDTGALYRALIDLADHEPELLTHITFDGFVLELHGYQENRQKVLASLHKRLSQHLYHHLENALSL